MAESATIRDVSRYADVSIATVSRAFSNPEKLSAKTLKKVQDAAQVLNYKPNSLAQIFRTNQSNTIVVMVPDLSNGFFTGVLSGIESVATAAGYALLLSDTRDDLAKEISCVELLDSRRVDGIIQLGKTSLETMCSGRDVSAIPFVHAIEATHDTAAPSVMIDNAAASERVAQYLIDLGHINIGLIGGPQNSSITQFRLEGTRDAMSKAGLSLTHDHCVFGPFTMQSGEASAAKLLALHPSLTACICMSDALAIGAMKYMREAGMVIPRDISVAGFDNVAYSAFCDPALTTMTQPALELGAAAMNMLVKQLTKVHINNTSKLFEAELVIRESCSAPPIN